MNRLLALLLIVVTMSPLTTAADTLVFPAKDGGENAKHIVLISGDEEYRTEESMPMLGKILSQRHGFKCTVLFAFGPDGADYIDANNQQGLRGLEALDSADLMLIGTRFRRPDEKGAKHITDFLNAGKPVIGIRTATHAFNGGGSFGGIGYGEFGRKILGEQWVSHHGGHKRQGARGVIEKANATHPVLNSVKDVFGPSDVYGVTHLTDADQILLRGAVTETLDPSSKAIDGPKNNPMHPFAWLHTYKTPDGKSEGHSFCTTGGASVDFLSEDLRRLVVNAAYHLTGRDVPEKADVAFVDPFYPSFYGFIREKNYWKDHNVKPEDFGLGKTPHMPDPPGTPEWNFREKPPEKSASNAAGWKPLFNGKNIDGWKVTNFGGEGEVYVEKGNVVITQGVDLSGITSTRKDLPKVNYEIEFEAQRAEGSDFFVGMTFPVLESSCSLICGGWGGGVCGLSSIDGMDASENETTSYLAFTNGKWYKIRIKVTDEKIQAWIDKTELADVELKDRKIDVRFEVDLSKPMGFSTYQSTAWIRNARIRQLPKPKAVKK